MVDQRAKNMFLTSWGATKSGCPNYIWYFIFYDNDTCLGINNEGVNTFNYNIEYHDTVGTQTVWNGEQSVLWQNVEECFADEIKALYETMRSDGCLSYSKAIEVLRDEQCAKWSEALYNADAQYKYIDPLLEDGNGSYLYAAQGSREHHRSWWLFNRFRYMDSRWDAGDFVSDFIAMRLYTPSVYAGVTPSGDFTITPYADQYIKIKYGSYVTSTRGTHSVATTINAPAMTFNDTETVIYGASRIASVGDLSDKYAGTIDVARAVKLNELIIGSDAEGYQNTNLTALTLGNNTLLKKLDIRNCPNLTQTVDASGCSGIEEIYAQRSGVTGVLLPNGGYVKRLYLPATITNLSVMNQTGLTAAHFNVINAATGETDYSNILTLRVENSPGIPTMAILAEATRLSRIRLLGINWTLDDTAIIDRLVLCNGIDANGYNIDFPVITGACHFNMTMTVAEFLVYVNRFPDVVFTVDTLSGVFITSDGKYLVDSNDDIILPDYVSEYTADTIATFSTQTSNHLGGDA